MSFVQLCATVVICTLVMAAVLAPVLWDAAGYVENILNTIYHVEFTAHTYNGG